MIAKTWNLDAGLFASLKHGDTGFDLDLGAVYGDFYHATALPYAHAARPLLASR